MDLIEVQIFEEKGLRLYTNTKIMLPIVPPIGGTVYGPTGVAHKVVDIVLSALVPTIGVVVAKRQR